jgi:hypothetical protein
MIRAQLTTSNFTFEAYGQTTSHARNALVRGLEQHATQYNLPADWWKDFGCDIAITWIQLNTAYRDNEVLKSK